MKMTNLTLVPALALLLTLAQSAQSGTIVTFGLGADDYGSLTIDGQSICSYDDIYSAGGCIGTFDMTPGVWYPIEIVYENRLGSDGLSLNWDQPEGDVSIGFGYPVPGSSLLVPLTALRTPNLAGTEYVSGLRGDYYDLSGDFQSTVIGEGPIDAGNNLYDNQVVGSWNGYGYFSQFEEVLTGEVSLPSAPEPASLALLGVGTAVLLLIRRKAARHGPGI